MNGRRRAVLNNMEEEEEDQGCWVRPEASTVVMLVAGTPPEFLLLN
jgi:hypothetical protein